MSRAKTFISKLNEEKELYQYAKRGKSSAPIGNSHQTLDPGIYDISLNLAGQAVFTKTEVKSDVLLNLRNKTKQFILSEFRNFWSPEVKSRFEKMGFIHKRGFIYEGPPGTGKSCDMKLIMNEVVASGDVVFLANSAYDLAECLKQFKEVEPDRHVAVIMEDFEKMADYGERILLELLDGPTAVSSVFYLATTNFIHNVSERMKRKSRFDRIIHVGLPEYEDRLEYLKNKLGTNETVQNIDHLAKETKGKSFADLKDVLVAIYCLGYSISEVLLEMNKGKLREYAKGLDEPDFVKKFKESREILKKNNVSLNEMFTPKHLNDYLNSLVKNVWGDKFAVRTKVTNQNNNLTEKSRASKFLELVDKDDNVDVETPSEPATNVGRNPEEQSIDGPIDVERVMKELTQRLSLLNIKGISVEDIYTDDDGSIYFTLKNEKGDEVNVCFSHEEDGMFATVKDSDFELDLGNNAPGVLITPEGKYINMYALGWLEKETIMSLLNSKEVLPNKGSEQVSGKDAFGNRLPAAPGV